MAPGCHTPANCCPFQSNLRLIIITMGCSYTCDTYCRAACISAARRKSPCQFFIFHRNKCSQCLKCKGLCFFFFFLLFQNGFDQQNACCCCFGELDFVFFHLESPRKKKCPQWLVIFFLCLRFYLTRSQKPQAPSQDFSHQLLIKL